MSTLPSTQKAVALPAKRSPLVEISTPVHPPAAGEVVVHVQWTASSPLDLHRSDGGLLITSYPALQGSGGAVGTVVATGSGGDLKGLQVGDHVSTFAFHGGKEANQQQYITIPAYLASKVPEGIPLQAAVTVPVNLVTVFHSVTADLELELPWPIPKDWKPKAANRPILVWGASSSVGIFAIQVLRHWGYTNVLTVSSNQHHEYLKNLGATVCFDYRKPDVVNNILDYLKDAEEPKVPYILDCIGSLNGTLEPLAKIAQRGSRVAVMLPVIVKDASEEEEPVYEMDVSKCLPGKWANGAIVRGVRTHFYLQNDFFKEKLQPEILPSLLAQGIIKPNNQRVVEGATLVERAQNALTLLRSKAVSGEKLVYKVSEA
ncbi:chaperonin 10-like protein [Gamsiella multidivaricata]|uniref:chaperonin 10-like protein n=1 Tax=Gamsiella multidivaricata TaxID=101098 RepID=UPI002220970D|nr:chaperonin 10-like protein [Gamsiella multidivaricata]KAI7816637.1 chaperonin 10-like protein [Gamsiella multidivaricata]